MAQQASAQACKLFQRFWAEALPAIVTSKGHKQATQVIVRANPREAANSSRAFVHLLYNEAKVKC